MTPDERTALNEAVCKRLGWTLLPGQWRAPVWETPGDAGFAATPDFTSDWNAVYRWIVPAVKEMGGAIKVVRFAMSVIAHSGDRSGIPLETAAIAYHLYATPEDYCRAFLAETKVNDGQ